MSDELHGGVCLGDLLALAVERFPDRVALIDGERSLTYREMAARVSRIVQALHARGIRRGDGLVQLATNRAEAPLVHYACYVAGIRYTPLHPLGSLDDHVFITGDAEAKALVIDAAAFPDHGATLAERAGVARVLTLGPANYGEDLLALAEDCAPGPVTVEAERDDIALIAYTGGTTGRSKGVVHRQRSLVQNIMMTLAEWEWPEEIRLLAATPITHAVGAMMLPAFLRGGTVVLHKGFDADAFLDAVERHRITATFLVPTMVYVLLDHPRIAETDLSSLDMVVYGAAPMSPARLQEAMEVFGPVFMQLYAQTEAPNTVTALRKTDHDPAHPERLASCGRPLAGIRVRLLDDDLNEVPVGDVGEICVRGPLVMEGYWKRPEETEATLRGGWLHTGDLARRDEHGYIYIVDRAKDMIVSGGFNVYPREIEDVLTAHPGVSMAAVIGVPDPKWGEAVKAIVVKRPEAAVTADELIALVREKKGPVYAPKSVEFDDDLPVTPLGKPDKKAVRARYWAGQERQVG